MPGHLCLWTIGPHILNIVSCCFECGKLLVDIGTPSCSDMQARIDDWAFGPFIEKSSCVAQPAISPYSIKWSFVDPVDVQNRGKIDAWEQTLVNIFQEWQFRKTAVTSVF